MYCPRRFALINTDKIWNENAYIVMANIMHNRVHIGIHKIVSNSKYELSDVTYIMMSLIFYERLIIMLPF